jgi:putative transposase
MKTAERRLSAARGDGLKAQPMVYRWTNGAGWVDKRFTEREVMRMKVVNREP